MLLSEFPCAKQVARAHMTHLKAVLSNSSRGHYGRDMAETIRDAARCSVGSASDLRDGEIPAAIQQRCISPFSHKLKQASGRTSALLYPF